MKILMVMVMMLSFCGSCFAQSIEGQLYQQRVDHYRHEQLRYMREQAYYMRQQEKRQEEQERKQRLDEILSVYDNL